MGRRGGKGIRDEEKRRREMERGKGVKERVRKKCKVELGETRGVGRVGRRMSLVVSGSVCYEQLCLSSFSDQGM